VVTKVQTKPAVLIVEDEDAIRAGLEDVFIFHGYSVESAQDGNEGLTKALTGKFDMILLDIMLPGIDGLEICHRVRSHDPDQAIIMLTAKSSDEDIIHGLSLGADDYVSKPFSVAQLVLRVKAVLRRSGTSQLMQNTITLGNDLKVDCLNLTVIGGGKEITFTRKEIEVLQYLAANNERPVSREELLNKVWGYAKNLDIETRTVDIHIAKLRRKIEPETANPTHLVTVRGAGYKLVGSS